MPEYPSKIEELTYDERAKWGTCPICGVGQGEWCNGEGSPQIGQPVGGGPIPKGVHVGRLQAAPTKRVISYIREG